MLAWQETEVAVGPEGNEPVSAPVPDGEKDAPREPKEAREPPFAEETPPNKQQKEEPCARKEPEQRHADSDGFSFNTLTLDTRRRGHKPRAAPAGDASSVSS